MIGGRLGVLMHGLFPCKFPWSLLASFPSVFLQVSLEFSCMFPCILPPSFSGIALQVSNNFLKLIAC
jgi:hypothetical protein